MGTGTIQRGDNNLRCYCMRWKNKEIAKDKKNLKNRSYMFHNQLLYNIESSNDEKHFIFQINAQNASYNRLTSWYLWLEESAKTFLARNLIFEEISLMEFIIEKYGRNHKVHRIYRCEFDLQEDEYLQRQCNFECKNVWVWSARVDLECKIFHQFYVFATNAF